MKFSEILAPLAFVFLVTANSFAQTETEQRLRQAVVKVRAIQQWPHWLQPWRSQRPRAVYGSGTIIDGRRILTNAHLVMHAIEIDVQPYQSSDKLAARVDVLAPGIDLAVLKLENEAFFKDRPALKFASGVPEVNDAVRTYGYPVGGSSLATTRGTVSRIQYGSYNYGESGLQIEISAPVNPGGSGGPAIVNGQMVGLVFGGSAEGQNIGYLIPVEEIRACLQQETRSRIHGKLQIRDDVQALENDALRARLQLDRNTTGIMVRTPFSTERSYPLKKEDVITRIGDFNIDNAGMVRTDDGLRLAFSYLVPKLAKQSRVPVTIQRDGANIPIDVPVVNLHENSLVPYLKGERPSYFVWGPLCFTPASGELVDALSLYLSEQWIVRKSPLIDRRYNDMAFDGEQLVIVTAMFSHKISRGYSNPFGQVVSHVNGVRIRDLGHLVKTLRDATDQFIEIEFNDKYVETLVFERNTVDEAMEDILVRNGIRQQYSPDLRSLWHDSK